jgi:hypothetical protein
LGGRDRGARGKKKCDGNGKHLGHEARLLVLKENVVRSAAFRWNAQLEESGAAPGGGKGQRRCLARNSSAFSRHPHYRARRGLSRRRIDLHLDGQHHQGGVSFNYRPNTE